MNKQEELMAWKEANPGKTRREWLLEVRCPDDETRREFTEFLNFCDENGIELWIPSPVKYINYEKVFFDFMVKNFGSYYDLDTPDELYTGKSGYFEAGWKPFLEWKIQQMLNENPDKEPVRGFVDTREMEESFPFFVNTKSLKWNNPEVLETLKKCSKG